MIKVMKCGGTKFCTIVCSIKNSLLDKYYKDGWILYDSSVEDKIHMRDYCWDCGKPTINLKPTEIDKKIKKAILANKIRIRREAECFPIINRGQAWYNILTKEQKAELQCWYEAWLSAPETLFVPEKPTWLK